jgi:hypothetical protein
MRRTRAVADGNIAKTDNALLYVLAAGLLIIIFLQLVVWMVTRLKHSRYGEDVQSQSTWAGEPITNGWGGSRQIRNFRQGVSVS